MYVTWSTGIGAGAYVDGRLLLGKNKNALHLGHTYIAFDDEGQPRCGCGNYGHVEAYASGTSIARDYGVDTVEVFRRYRQGDRKARKVVERAACVMARGLANAATLLDTSLIIVGGSVMNDWDVLESLVKNEFYSAFPPLTRQVDIRPSSLDQYLGDIAALSLIMPLEWISDWQDRRPWESSPAPEVLAGKEGY